MTLFGHFARSGPNSCVPVHGRYGTRAYARLCRVMSMGANDTSATQTRAETRTGGTCPTMESPLSESFECNFRLGRPRGSLGPLAEPCVNRRPEGQAKQFLFCLLLKRFPPLWPVLSVYRRYYSSLEPKEVFPYTSLRSARPGPGVRRARSLPATSCCQLTVRTLPATSCCQLAARWA